jgi:prepilin-type N-terminal cleavage/methylation domain-containing protein
MKKLKLNRKGFTLIELLAVIVILAIVMTVTIPSVLSSMNKARSNQLQNAADSVSEWFTKQYELAAMGDFAGSSDAAFNTFLGTLGTGSTFESLNSSTSIKTKVLTTAVLNASGISNSDKIIDLGTGKSYVYYNTSINKMCVVLFAKSGGSYYVNTSGASNKACSSGCSGDC